MASLTYPRQEVSSYIRGIIADAGRLADCETIDGLRDDGQRLRAEHVPDINDIRSPVGPLARWPANG